MNVAALPLAVPEILPTDYGSGAQRDRVRRRVLRQRLGPACLVLLGDSVGARGEIGEAIIAELVGHRVLTVAEVDRPTLEPRLPALVNTVVVGVTPFHTADGARPVTALRLEHTVCCGAGPGGGDRAHQVKSCRDTGCVPYLHNETVLAKLERRSRVDEMTGVV